MMNLKKVTIITAFSVFLIYGTLIISLGWFWESSALNAIINSERTFFAIKISLLASPVAALLAITLAIPAAYALSRYKFFGRELIDLILELPIIVSPAALGAMLLIFFNNPLGEWLQENVLRFVFTFAGIVLAQFITILGLAVRIVKTSFDEVSPELETVAKTLGATPFFCWRTITLPLAKKGIFAAFLLAWAKSLGEFGATITIAGTMAMRTETLPVAIFLKLATANIEDTVALIVILVTIGLIALYFTKRLLKGVVHAEN